MSLNPKEILEGNASVADLAMFEFYKKNPDIACIDLLNQDLAPFQRVIIKGVMFHSYVISVLSRGSGKTRMMAMCAALLCMFNPKMRVGFLAPGFRQAKLAFAEFEAILSEAPYLEACVKRISKQTDVWSVEFYNGAFIFALPLAADSAASIRGVRLHTALIDEYPHVPKEVLDLVINPMLATQRNPMANVRRIQKERQLIAEGKLKEEDLKQSLSKNKVCGFSSAYFQFNHMYQTIQKYKEKAVEQKEKTGKTDYAIYIFNYKDAPEGFFDIQMIEHARATSSEVAFNMEYLSEFPSDSDGFFKRSLIDSCRPIKGFGIELAGDQSGKFMYVMGIDPARNSDNFAINIIRVDKTEMRVVRQISYTKTAFPIIADKIRELLDIYNIQLIGMDSGGGGLAMKDLLADPTKATDLKHVILDMEDEETIGKHGRRILKMVNFNPKWIADANFDMRASLEHKRLLFPDLELSETYIRPDTMAFDEEDNAAAEYFKMIDELQSIIMTSTKTGVLHFDVPVSGKRKDRYTSLLIAHKIAYDFIQNGFQKRELASGGVLGPGGLLTAEQLETDEWDLTRSIDELERQASLVKRGKAKIEDGAIG